MTSVRRSERRSSEIFGIDVECTANEVQPHILILPTFSVLKVQMSEFQLIRVQLTEGQPTDVHIAEVRILKPTLPKLEVRWGQTGVQRILKFKRSQIEVESYFCG